VQKDEQYMFMGVINLIILN